MTICTVDLDHAFYVGTGDDGVYFAAEHCTDHPDGKNGWYLTTVIDSNTGGFIQNGVSDDGPYATEADALIAGWGAAAEWLTDNEIFRGWRTEGNKLYRHLQSRARKEPSEFARQLVEKTKGVRRG